MTNLAYSVNEFVVLGTHVCDGTARSLDLLRKIERTVLSISTIAGELRVWRGLIGKLREAMPDGPIPEGGVVPSLEKTEDKLSALHEIMQRKKQAALDDPRLTADDGVADIYARAMEAVCDLHESIEELRWAILNHNASLEKTDESKNLSDPEEIERFLRSIT